MEPEPIVIHDGACQYRIIKPIGTWGPKFDIPVFEAVILPETNNLPHVALKMVDRNDKNIYFAIEEVRRITVSFKFLPRSILPIKNQFHTRFNKVPHYCTVLLFDTDVTSLRSLISSRPMIAGGIPQSCLAAVLLRTLVGLHEVHSIRSIHDQITAGNIFYHHNDGTIKLAYAASVYERTVPDPGPVQPIQCPAAAHDQEASSSSNPNPDQNQGAPINLMLDWARAPEVVQSGDRGLDSYIYTSKKSDIWLIGIVALELAYGKIRVANREEMLSIAGFIGNSSILPNTWEELRMIAAGGEITEDSVSRFSKSFGDFVGKCLTTYPRKRATMNWLWNHDFLKNSESMAIFENVVVKGLSPSVASAACVRTRNDRQLSERRRSNLGSGDTLNMPKTMQVSTEIDGMDQIQQAQDNEAEKMTEDHDKTEHEDNARMQDMPDHDELMEREIADQVEREETELEDLIRLNKLKRSRRKIRQPTWMRGCKGQKGEYLK